MTDSKDKAAKKVDKKRLDVVVQNRLAAEGLASSRKEAQALIMSGAVLLGGRRLEKAGIMVAEDAALVIKQKPHPYVSRGGVKLAAAFEHAPEFITGFMTDTLSVGGMTAVDIGASTGGFTDVLLRHGASKVFAVDVGVGQLAWSLRNDPRVVVLEKTNARYLTGAEIGDVIDFVVCDASFISLKKVLPAALGLARRGAGLAALIKPQFEVGRTHIGKGGVVRDAALHRAVQEDIAAWLEGVGWGVEGCVASPITGPQGNQEFIIMARKG